jgi:hypothetical protein
VLSLLTLTALSVGGDVAWRSLLMGVKKRKFAVDINLDGVGNALQHEDGSKKQHSGPSSTFLAHTVTGPAVYHLGIVDFLQNWTLHKRIERLGKIYVQRKDPDGLSVMHPLQYKLRFQAKMEQIFDLDHSSANIVQPQRQLGQTAELVLDMPQHSYKWKPRSPNPTLEPAPKSEGIPYHDDDDFVEDSLL